MFDYLKSELYRILIKKDMYVYFGVLLVLYLGLAFIQSSTLTLESVATQGEIVFTLLSLLGGGYLFSVLFNDDLQSKSLSQIIGFGKRRWQIVTVKYLLGAAGTALMFAMGSGLLWLIFNFLGYPFDTATWQVVRNLALMGGIKLFAFLVIASIVAYGTQKSTLSLVAFVLLASNFVTGILSLLLGMAGSLGELISRFTISGILLDIIGGHTPLGSLKLLIYVTVFGILALLSFYKKDLEF